MPLLGLMVGMSAKSLARNAAGQLKLTVSSADHPSCSLWGTEDVRLVKPAIVHV